jgi:cupin superfamily acireductone dioxygenase involved in methionine salvage
MKQMKEEDYNRKLTAIEGKFKIICERYQLITEEMKSKDQVIHKMTGEISELEMKLEMANATIARLEKQANKTDLLQKTYYLRHKAKLESNELIESESSSNQIKSRAHISKNGVRS